MHFSFGSDSDPSLWTYALSYFASIEDQDCSEEIQEVLARIDRNNLLPPLRVRPCAFANTVRLAQRKTTAIACFLSLKVWTLTLFIVDEE